MTDFMSASSFVCTWLLVSTGCKVYLFAFYLFEQGCFVSCICKPRETLVLAPAPVADSQDGAKGGIETGEKYSQDC